eukprot:gene32654-39479_t
MLVSTKLYHYEVIAFLAAHLKRLGLVTTVHTAFGIRFDKEGTLELLRSLSSSVHNIDTLSIQEIPTRIKVLVIISSDDQSDINQLCKLNLYNKLFHNSEKVLMVVHNAKMVSRMLKMCQPPKCNLLVLDEFVRKTAMKYLWGKRQDHIKVHTTSSVIDLPDGFLANSTRALGNSNRFGTKLLVLPGTIRYNRRDYAGLFSCVEDVLRNNKNNTASMSSNFKIVITGRSYLKAKDGRVIVPMHLRHLIEKRADLTLKNYFALLARASFVLSFANAKQLGYTTIRISSTIPSALGVETPLALPRSTLELYDCLKASPLHRRVAGMSDCDALKNALRLSSDEVKRMRLEAAACRQKLLRDAYAELRGLVYPDGPISSSSNGTVQDQCSLLPI